MKWAKFKTITPSPGANPVVGMFFLKINQRLGDLLNTTDPIAALIFSFIFPGLGQMYTGKRKRGQLYAGIHLLILFAVLLFLLLPSFSLNIFVLAALAVFILFEIFVILDAYLTALKKARTKVPAKFTFQFKHFVLIPSLFVSMFVLNGNIWLIESAQNYIVTVSPPEKTSSMEPVIQKGDMFLINKICYRLSAPQRGEVIVFNYPKDLKRAFVKRIAALGGERVEITNGKASVNGKILDAYPFSNIYYTNGNSENQPFLKANVPPGHYFVLGDNSSVSKDSRYFGFVPKENIIGKATKIILPLKRASVIR